MSKLDAKISQTVANIIKADAKKLISQIAANMTKTSLKLKRAECS